MVMVKAKTFKKKLREVEEVRPRRRRPSNLQQLSSNLKEVRAVKRRRRIVPQPKRRNRRLNSLNLPPQSPRARRRRLQRKPRPRKTIGWMMMRRGSSELVVEI